MMLFAFLLLLVTFVATALCTYLLTLCYIHYALRRGVIDTPNDRSSHTIPTPRGGGVSIVIVSLLLLTVALLTENPWLAPIPSSNIAALLVGGTLVAAIGFIDDVRSLSSKIRFSTHFIASLAALCLITPLPSLPLLGTELAPEGNWAIKGLWIFVAALGLTWLINLYNFMDGIDGIAATEGLTVLLGAAFIGAAVTYIGPAVTYIGPAVTYIDAAETQYAFPWMPLIVLTAPLIGFLILNWSPARIFMGDGCSGFLGITLGLLAIMYAANTPLNLWTWAILLGVFIVDACWTLTTRVLTGQQWHQPHRSHCYQILSRKWQSHSKVTLGTGAINLLWLTPLALLASLFPSYGWLCLLLAYGPLLLLCRAHGAGLHN